MSKAKPKFAPGDKVFAKVRGYPPWPARIEGLADETPNKMRYHVYFYGTGETAVIKAEDVFNFVENKVKFGKPKKQKYFTEALLQIEADLSPDDVKKANDLVEKLGAFKGSTLDKTTDLDISVNNSDSPKTSAPRRSSTSLKAPKQASLQVVPECSPQDTQLQHSPQPVTPSVSIAPSTYTYKPKENKKRKLDDLHDEAESRKRRASVSMPDDTKISLEVMSRSGRKIKPKRFADFEEGFEGEEETISFNGVSEINDDDKENSNDYIVATISVNETVKIPLKVNRPEFCTSRSAAIWDEMVLTYANSLKKRIESGENIGDVYGLMTEWTSMKSFELARERAPEESKQKYEFLGTESQMLHIEINIKSSLNLERAEPAKCLVLLEKLNTLKITPLMLKKHPELVQTIKKMRRYVGNVSCWNLNDEELVLFKRDAARIRLKSEHVYNKFQSLFLNPKVDNFWDFFSEEVKKFQEKTSSMTLHEQLAIIQEPE